MNKKDVIKGIKQELDLVKGEFMEYDKQALEEVGVEIGSRKDIKGIDFEFSPVEMATYHLGKIDTLERVLYQLTRKE